MLDEFYGPNAGYVAELLERYEREPRTVDAATRAALADWQAASHIKETIGPETFPPDIPAAASAAALAQGVRFFGHLGAHLDPLGSAPPGDPQLELSTHGIAEDDLRRLPASVVGGPLASQSDDACEAIGRLSELYRGTSGYEFGHVAAPEERRWLLEAVESERFRPPTDAIDERGLFDRLTEVAAFERFIHRAYPGQTRFSVEGLGMMIPMLYELVDRAAEAGTRTVMLGMAHRGRLNVLAHVLGKPYERILAEFEGRAAVQRTTSDGGYEGWTGDVKYHAGARRAYRAEEDPGFGEGTGWRTVTVVLAPNPSHLELVNPIVQGMARAADENRRKPGPPGQDDVASLAVLIHGDASFIGQGVVAEALNLSRLTGYRTGGTLHLIANNQLGFTTDPADGRSTLYASDLAKGFEIPVVHVNADDPIACLAAVRLAVGYRSEFRKDFLIDLVGYRRWGHNEGDEPSFTQPLMYEAIKRHPTVRELYAEDLVRRSVLRPDDPDRLLKTAVDEFRGIRESVVARARQHRETAETERARDEEAEPRRDGATERRDDGATERRGDAATEGRGDADSDIRLASSQARPVSLEDLRSLNAALYTLPEGFSLNPKLGRAVQRRREALESDEAQIDWGHAETLAFASILRDGIPIRLSGQDTVRGTFSQRHLTFFDAGSGDGHTPLAALPEVNVSFDCLNSPLSEAAALGFEYGYSMQAPDTLVIWEAQYGDFINGAQAIVDEYLVSAQAKWSLTSGLVLLLPHAWEGQGPDHSGGRLERFLQLAAEGNLAVANCTTAAQYFHLLRRQAASLRADPRPLVVMTPKGLLRHPISAARPSQLARGAFEQVIDDVRTASKPERVRRLALCSGKVWADVEAARNEQQDETLAVVRVEQLYPFPGDLVGELLAKYSATAEVVWLQEEPRNAGAWTFVEPRIREILGSGRALRYVGRPERASPAEGWADVHSAEQRRLVEAVVPRQAAVEEPRALVVEG